MCVFYRSNICYSLFFYTKLLYYLKIDDPVDAFAIHLGCGSFGLIAVGWFDPNKGVLYGKGCLQFGYQMMGLVSIFLWTFVNGYLFLIFFKFQNMFRISEEEELHTQTMLRRRKCLKLR